MKLIKKWVKQLLPPIVATAMRHLCVNRQLSFSGDYARWKDAQHFSHGYDDVAIKNRVLEAALKVKRGEAIFERDSVCFYREEYRWPALTCLLNVACEKSGELRVIDFGGALGSFYFQHRKFFKRLNHVTWFVVEQKQFVECGIAQMQDDVLRFHDTLDQCIDSGNVDVIFLSSVLQYLESPYEILKLFASMEVQYLLIDRTPFIHAVMDRLTVQHVPSSIYKASYPAWFFSQEKFDLELANLGYRKIADFPCDELSPLGEYKGCFFERL